MLFQSPDCVSLMHIADVMLHSCGGVLKHTNALCGELWSLLDCMTRRFAVGTTPLTIALDCHHALAGPHMDNSVSMQGPLDDAAHNPCSSYLPGGTALEATQYLSMWLSWKLVPIHSVGFGWFLQDDALWCCALQSRK